MPTLYPELMESLIDAGLEKQATTVTELLKRYKYLLRGGRVKELKGVDLDGNVLKDERLKVLLARLGTGAVPVGAGAVAHKKLKKNKHTPAKTLTPLGKKVISAYENDPTVGKLKRRADGSYTKLDLREAAIWHEDTKGLPRNSVRMQKVASLPRAVAQGGGGHIGELMRKVLKPGHKFITGKVDVPVNG